MTSAIEPTGSLVRWNYLWTALLAITLMIAAIAIGNLWFLNFVHVFSSLLWTGIDLFMGFVLGPILKRVDLPVRREIVRRLTPRTLFLMPTVSIISGTTGWFLAVMLGYTAFDLPAYGWVAAALILVTLMTIQGLGFLTPINVLVCLELQKSEPNMRRIGAWMQGYFYAVAMHNKDRDLHHPHPPGFRNEEQTMSNQSAAPSIPPAFERRLKYAEPALFSYGSVRSFSVARRGLRLHHLLDSAIHGRAIGTHGLYAARLAHP